MNKLLAGILSIFLFFRSGAAFGAENNCPLPAGLFERRSALSKALGAYLESQTPGVEGFDNATASKELEFTNEMYFEFMTKVTSGGEGKGTFARAECCRNSSTDTLANLICKFSDYLRTTPRNPRLLLESAPTGPKGRDAIWALDEIAYLHAKENPENVPSLFKPYGPVTLYLDELYGLVRLGNKEAISQYLELYSHSSGEYAELMDDHLQKLLKNDVALVLLGWDAFEPHREALLKLRDSLTSNEKKALRTKLSANKACATHSSACGELKTLLAK